jgi:hypothetical protein
MTHDQNKKALRHFQCREYLWEIFEQMSAELECSTDYLINEAMRQYARSRNYGNRTPGMSVPRMGGTGAGIPPLASRNPARPAIPSAPPPPPQRPQAPMGYGPGYASGPPSGTFPHPRGGYPPGGGGPYAAPAPRPPQPPSSYPPGAPRTGPGGAPPPLPHGGSAPPRSAGGVPTLYVIFNGQKIPIRKEEFVIGRGSKTADLAIKDGNISRRHAAIVFQGGAFFFRDLGSTNGIEFGGQRIDSKHIEEGDTFHICDYELRFTYR